MLIATGSVRSLDVCVAVYVHDLEEDAQVDFKGKAKTFVQTYAFLSCVPPYTNAEWEKRSIFLNFLIMKLPAPDDENLSKGILDAIDVDSYGSRSGLCRRSCCPTRTPRSRPYRPAAAVTGRSPSRTASQNILKAFKDLFGDIAWQDRDRVGRTHHQDGPSPGGGGFRLQERTPALRRSERPHRARQVPWSAS